MRRFLLAAVITLLVCSSQSRAEVAQWQGLRIAVEGKLTPPALPRRGTAPVAVYFAGRISSTSAAGPPQLARLSIAISSHGHLFTQGLPRCRAGHITPSTTTEALAACGDSLIGEGHFSAAVKLPEQSPFPSEGKVLAFNGRLGGRPAILAHIYGTEPVPTSYVLPFRVDRTQGTYRTLLEASLPAVTGEWGFVTGISMKLERTFVVRGHRRSYLSAGCPAPPGVPSVVFPLARTTFTFEGGLAMSSVLDRRCRVER